MPAFVLDTGNATGTDAFAALDEFTRGYVECLFFTDTGYEENGELEKATVGDLSPEGLARIVKDCADFQAENAEILGAMSATLNDAGNDFWYSRNGHGTGFWDRDESRYSPEQAKALHASAKGYGEVYSAEYFNEIGAIRMTSAELWGYAAQWGSFDGNGDPGACMYGFDERFRVQSESHRVDCLAWIEGCRADVNASPADYDDDELAKLEYLATAIREAASDESAPVAA